MAKILKNKSAKHIQVDKARAKLMAVVAGASVITVFALVASKSYFSQAGYWNRVGGEKEKALKQLVENKEAVSKLVESYKTFADQSPNLLGGSNTGNGEHDGDNGRLILDALPSKYDFPALTSSIEKLLAGFKITGITGNDDALAQISATGGASPVDIPFSISVNTNYTELQKLVGTFEHSIRPFQVLSFDLTGSNNNLQVTLNLKTFFQSGKDLKIETKVVK